SPLENYLSTDNITRSKQPASAAEVLSIRELLPHLCSAGAGLTGSTRVDGLEHTPSVFGFVREFREESSPTYIGYRLGEHATSQALDVQIFDGNYTEVLDQPERKLVLKLVSLVLDRRSCNAALYKRQASPNCTPNSSLSSRVVNSRYLNVLRMRCLVRNIPFNCCFRDSTDAADVAAPRLQTRQIRLEPRKFFSKLVAGESLELCRQPCWCHSWVTLNEPVNVVGHDFQSVNFCLNFFRFLVQFAQALFESIDEDALAILG